MANFCIECGNPVQPHWKFCPSCSTPVYCRPKSIIQYSPVIKKRIRKKPLTRFQTKAIIIGTVISIAAVIIPIVSVFSYNYNNPKRTVQFYVNNGLTPSSYTVITTRSTLDYYSEQPHPSHSSIDPYNTALIIESYCTLNDELLIEIAQDVRSKCVDQGDSEEVINALLSFTQAIGYKSEVIDRAKYPIETIFNKGDCEDLSVLFGSLISILGFEAVLVILSVYNEVELEWMGHACIGVYLNFTPTQHWSYPPSHSFTIDGDEYWICETTDQGWMIGALPTSNPSYFVMEGYAFID
ncbi:MAG: zinc-ribbon domain-containing protein [Candidatus Heimdallarchaeota archaeon]